MTAVSFNGEITMSDESARKSAIKQYLTSNGIRANSKGYKVLFYAILQASYYPEMSCSDLFEEAARILSAESPKPVDASKAYRNAHYAIKNSKNGAYEGGPYAFIKSCSIELESM